ncbi:MAG: hypothetical protein OXT69_01515 [Candidatus Poribacteria bacterium]|nr:hypothetical protein [Candidatus Poribacteria bacterium]
MKNRRRGVLLLAIAAAVVGAVVLFWARRHWELSPGVLESRLSELDISEEAMKRLSEDLSDLSDEERAQFADDLGMDPLEMEWCEIALRVIRNESKPGDMERLKKLNDLLFPGYDDIVKEWLEEQTPEGKAKKRAEYEEHITMAKDSLENAIEMEAMLAGEPGGAERIEVIKAAERHLAAVEKWVSIELNENSNPLDHSFNLKDAIIEVEKQDVLMSDAYSVAWETRELAHARKAIEQLQHWEKNSIGEEDRTAAAKALKAAEAWAAASEEFLDIMRRKREQDNYRFSEEASAAKLKASDAMLVAYRAQRKWDEVYRAAKHLALELEPPSEKSGGGSPRPELREVVETHAAELQTKTGKRYELPPPSPRSPDADAKSSLNAMVRIAKEYERSGFSAEAKAAYERALEYFTKEEVEEALRRINESADRR